MANQVLVFLQFTTDTRFWTSGRRDVARKTEGQDGVADSFLAGLFHSLQHAGLSRRTLINAVRVHMVFKSPSTLTKQVEFTSE